MADIIANADTGEIVSEADVRASIQRVINHAESIWDEWAWQVENQTWAVLGYADWDEMRRNEYGALTSVSPPRAERPELISRFRGAGLTQKETAATLGVSERTIKTYDQPSYQPRAPKVQNCTFEQPEVVDAEVIEDDDRPYALADDETIDLETGEIVPRPPAEPVVDVVSRFVDSDESVRLSGWRRNFMSAIGRSGELMLFDPADVAENADVDLINELERLSLDLNNYVARVRARRPHRLTAIKGGAQ